MSRTHHIYALCLLCSWGAAPACGGSSGDPDASIYDSGDPMIDSGDPLVDGGGQADAPGLGDVTVNPTRIDDVLINPGMGFADFHFGWWCNLPPITYTPEVCAARALENWPENYPRAGTAYFRWHWRAIEPTRGNIDFAMIDTAIQSANALGETLSFRVMMVDEGEMGVPDWLVAAPYSITGEWRASANGTTYWPDVRDATFQAEHARLVSALAARYDGHPAVDHVDIGSVGCWGEWNTACLTGEDSIIEIYDPASDDERDAIAAAYEQLIDDFTGSFATTPVVMLGQGGGADRTTDIMAHAMENGAGWRVDCWGDWDIFSDSWSHHDDAYPNMITEVSAVYPAFPDVWQHAPIQLEICATMPDWFDAGYSTDGPDGEVYKSFQWALEQHASLLNAKFTDIPASYVAAIDELLTENGYRFVIDSFNHASTVAPGGPVTLISTFANIGVAPMYIGRELTYRLRGASRTVPFTSHEDLRGWLPGTTLVTESFTLPGDTPPGTYQVEVAILDRAGTAPVTAPLAPLHLGIEGRGADGWYLVSALTVE